MALFPRDFLLLRHKENLRAIKATGHKLEDDNGLNPKCLLSMSEREMIASTSTR